MSAMVEEIRRMFNRDGELIRELIDNNNLELKIGNKTKKYSFYAYPVELSLYAEYHKEKIILTFCRVFYPPRSEIREFCTSLKLDYSQINDETLKKVDSIFIESLLGDFLKVYLEENKAIDHREFHKLERALRELTKLYLDNFSKKRVQIL